MSDTDTWDPADDIDRVLLMVWCQALTATSFDEPVQLRIQRTRMETARADLERLYAEKYAAGSTP